MAADATAASVYQGLVKNVDPIGAFSAGVQLRSNLQKIDLAAQAGQMDTLLNIVKIQNDQADSRIKEQLAKEQQQIAWYNAETNRINANRPRTAGGSSSTGGYAMPQIIDHGDGSFDIAMPGEQGPTSGEGDMTMPDAGGVLPLTNGPEGASLLPMGGNTPVEPGMAPLPGMGTGRGMTVASNSVSQPAARQQPMGSHVPGMPDPFGAAPVAAQQTSVAGPNGMAQATTTPTKKGKFEIGSFNPKTGSMSLRPISEKAEDAPVNPAPPEVLQKWSAIYDGFGKVAVPTTEKGFPQGFKFEDKPTLHGKDITSLSADEQKRFGTMATELMTIARDMRMPTPEAKMAAVGVTDPAQMTEQLWKDGWNKVAGPGAADALVMKATELAGFKNLMLGTNVHRPETILEQMGVDTAGMLPKQQAPTGRQVSVADSGQPLPAGSAAPAVKSSTADTSGQIARMEQEVAAEPDPAQKKLKQGFLTAMKSRAQSEAAPPAGAASGRSEEDPWSMPARSADEPPKMSNPRRDAANQQWENNKLSVVRALKSTLTEKEIQGIKSGDSTAMESDLPASMRGKTASEKQAEWVKKNAKSLGIKPQDGGELTLNSVVFIDDSGRGIKLKEIIGAVFDDPRFEKGAQAQRPSSTQAPSGNAIKVTVGTLTEKK